MNLAAIEAFARGAMSALLTGAETPTPQAPRRRNRRPARTTAAAPRPEPSRQMELPIDAPGAPGGIPPPPFSQAEAERMEAALRGEAPTGFYKPDEGVAPWMES